MTLKLTFLRRHVSRAVMSKLCIWLMGTWRIRTIVYISGYGLIDMSGKNGGKRRHPQRTGRARSYKETLWQRDLFSCFDCQ